MLFLDESAVLLVKHNLLMSKAFPKSIKDWYLQHKRDLPWRDTRDPYFIWLSEIILQQTRVAQGLPYYNKFVQKFPTVYDLANSKEESVLRVWQGLGYYSRGRNLHKTAKIIAENYTGKFPKTSTELLKLPGIGEYTASAIASFTQNEKIAVLDGNVFRVLSRFFGVETDIGSTEGKKEFKILANEVLPAKQVDIYNQGIMEFGALQCVPKNPNCGNCPIQSNCYAFHHKMVSILPKKEKKTIKKNRYLNYLIIEKEGEFLFHQRTGKDIWTNLFQFPLIEITDEDEGIFVKELEKLGDFESVKKVGKTYKHVLSHRNLWVNFYVISALKTSNFITENYKWFTLDEIAELPKPVLLDKFLRAHYF